MTNKVFLISRVLPYRIPPSTGSRSTDLMMDITINSKSYTIHFAWNAVGKYWSLNLVDSNGRSVRHLLPQFKEFYPIIGFDTEPAATDMLIGVFHDEDKTGTIAKKDLNEKVSVAIITGEVRLD